MEHQKAGSELQFEQLMRDTADAARQSAEGGAFVCIKRWTGHVIVAGPMSHADIKDLLRGVVRT